MVERSRTVIYQTTTKQETYEVVDEIYTRRFSRILYSGRLKTAQSGIPLDNNDQMLFEYNKRLVELVEEVKAKDILMIGGGGFTLPSYLIKKDPDIHFDVVEPDKDLEEIARRYFGLKSSKRLNISEDHGLHYLKKNKKKYDLIILDAYLEETIPKEVLSGKFAKLSANSLRPNGLIAANVITSLRADAVIYKMHSSYQKYFKFIKLYPVVTDRSYYFPHNLIYVASKQLINPHLKFTTLELPETWQRLS